MFSLLTFVCFLIGLVTNRHHYHLQLWDIDSLVQDSGKTVEGKSGADSDDDEMDMDTDDKPQKSSKGNVLILWFLNPAL